jgi:hypothetical protein
MEDSKRRKRKRSGGPFSRRGLTNPGVASKKKCPFRGNFFWSEIIMEDSKRRIRKRSGGPFSRRGLANPGVASKKKCPFRGNFFFERNCKDFFVIQKFKM